MPTLNQGKCPYILATLADAQTANAAQNKADAVGFLEALLSTPNNTQVIQAYDRGDGHRIDVRLKYLVRSNPAEAINTPSCTLPPTCTTYLEDNVTLTGYRQITRCVGRDYLSALCSDATETVARRRVNDPTLSNTPEMGYMQELLLTMMNGLRGAVNADLLTIQAVNFGVNVATGNNAAIDIPVLYATDGTKVELGIQTIDHHFTQNRATGSPLIIGLGNFNRFNTSMKYGCCNAGGTDFREMAQRVGYAFYRDHTVESILGANHLIVMAPGSVQLITYNRNRGALAGVHGSSEYFTVNDPLVPGLSYDAELFYQGCNENNANGQWNLRLSLNFGLYYQPADVFAPSDPLAGVNGTFRYRAVTL